MDPCWVLGRLQSCRSTEVSPYWTESARADWRIWSGAGWGLSPDWCSIPCQPRWPRCCRWPHSPVRDVVSTFWRNPGADRAYGPNPCWPGWSACCCWDAVPIWLLPCWPSWPVCRRGPCWPRWLFTSSGTVQAVGSRPCWPGWTACCYSGYHGFIGASAYASGYDSGWWTGWEDLRLGAGGK